MAGKNYYGVKKGLAPGVYKTWKECSENVLHFPGAEYKGFATREEAELYCGITYSGPDTPNSTRKENPLPDIYAFVDGSFNAKTNVYGYGGFLVVHGCKYELQGFGWEPGMAAMRNVAGEILGAMAAIQKAIDLKLQEVVIYYDYQGIESWATGEWKRNKKETIQYKDFCDKAREKIVFKFVKVKGHSGIAGNEEADRLAKNAVGLS